MPLHTKRAVAVGLALWPLLALATMSHPAVGRSDADSGGHVPYTESHPPPPSIQPDTLAARAAALTAGTNESSGDVSAMVVTHAVYARVAGDEEWRQRFGTGWEEQARAAMETADNEMFAEFGIDFRVWGYAAWITTDDSPRGICDLLGELGTDVSVSGADVVVGYVDNATSGRSYGCAASRKTIVKWHGFDNVWKTSQHEFSHLFNAPDRYPDPEGRHNTDVIEDHYNYADYWCYQAGYYDWGRVKNAAGYYD